MKKIITGSLICFAVVFLGFWLNWRLNESMIRDYEAGNYRVNPITFLGFTQPYVAPYNKGNVYMKQGDYEGAADLYEKALAYSMPEKKECSVRINLALAMILSLELEKLSKEDKEEVIAVLEKAQMVLEEKECAAKDGQGHSEEAQSLWNELEALKQSLQNSEQQEQQKQKENQEQEKDEKKEQEKKDKLKEIQEQGTSERGKNLDDYKYTSTYEYYGGKSW